MAGRKKNSGAAAAKRARKRITPLSKRDIQRFSRCLGLAYRDCRERRGLTVAQLAGLAFMQPRTVERLERGGKCRGGTHFRLAEVLGGSIVPIWRKAERMAGKPFC